MSVHRKLFVNESLYAPKVYDKDFPSTRWEHLSTVDQYMSKTSDVKFNKLESTTTVSGTKITASNGIDVTGGNVVINAGNLTLDSGGITVTTGDLTLDSGGITVNSGVVDLKAPLIPEAGEVPAYVDYTANTLAVKGGSMFNGDVTILASPAQVEGAPVGTTSLGNLLVAGGITSLTSLQSNDTLTVIGQSTLGPVTVDGLVVPEATVESVLVPQHVDYTVTRTLLKGGSTFTGDVVIQASPEQAGAPEGKGASGSLTVAGNLSVTGGLTVSGTTTTVNTTNLEVKDKVIMLNNGSTVGLASGETSGIEVERGTTLGNVQLVYKERASALLPSYWEVSTSDANTDTVASHRLLEVDVPIDSTDSGKLYVADTHGRAVVTKSLTGITINGLTVTGEITLPSGGSAAESIETVSATATLAKNITLVEATSSSITVTLPSAATNLGKSFTVYFKSRGNAGYNVSVVRAGTDVIEGDTSFILAEPGQHVRFTSIGLNGATPDLYTWIVR